MDDPTPEPEQKPEVAPIEGGQAPNPKPAEPTREQIETEIAERMRTEYEAKVAAAAEQARIEERERLAAEQADAAAKAEQEQREAEMSEIERLEAQRVEAQRLADEATARAEAEAQNRKQSDERASTLERQLEFQRALAATGHALARDQTGAVDPALEQLAFAEVERLRDGRDMAAALAEVAAVKPWMFHREQAPASPSTGGPNTPPARRIDPHEPVQGKPVFQMTDEEYAKTRRKIGIVR